MKQELYLSTEQPSVKASLKDHRNAMLQIAVAVACVLMLLASFAKKLQWVSRRTLTGALLVSSALVLSLASPEALALITIGLFLAGVYVLLRGWAKWNYSHIIVTRTRLRIGHRTPRIFLMEESEPSVAIKKLTSVKPVKPVFMRLLGLRCGSVHADTPGQQDEFVNNLRWVRDHEELASLLNDLAG